MNDIEFKVGQRVITPEGEGEVIGVNDDQVKVKLNSGETKIYNSDKLSDDSDAG